MLNQHINRQALAVFLNAPYFIQDCGISGRDSQINDVKKMYVMKKRYGISSNNSRGRLFLFSHKKEAIIRGKAIISNIAHWKSCPKYFVLFFL